MIARLLITADDAAQSHSIDTAISNLAKQQLITQVAAFATYDRLDVLRDLLPPSVQVGIHFNLSSGYPLLTPKEIPSLVEQSGRFYAPGRYYQSGDTYFVATLDRYIREVASGFEEDHIVAELRAQLAEYQRAMRSLPTFVTV